MHLASEHSIFFQYKHIVACWIILLWTDDYYFKYIHKILQDKQNHSPSGHVWHCTKDEHFTTVSAPNKHEQCTCAYDLNNKDGRR